jgi:hypothetical protein
MPVFVIEDELHAEWQGEFESFAAALAELRNRAAIKWDEAPNRPPCSSWPTCGREYVVLELDDQVTPWRELNRTCVLSIDAKGVTWSLTS